MNTAKHLRELILLKCSSNRLLEIFVSSFHSPSFSGYLGVYLSI